MHSPLSFKKHILHFSMPTYKVVSLFSRGNKRKILKIACDNLAREWSWNTPGYCKLHQNLFFFFIYLFFYLYINGLYCLKAENIS